MATPAHGRSLGGFPALRKPGGTKSGRLARESKEGGRAHCSKTRSHVRARGLRRGMVLVESMLALSILTVLGLLLLKLSINILHPRQWVLQQTITDAYMSFERAHAERIPFDNLLAADSPWPQFPTTRSSTVEIGRLPGNRIITGTVTRFRTPDPGNFPIDGGSGTLATNPAAMKIWRAQSVLTYEIGGRSYVKSRTVLRSQ